MSQYPGVSAAGYKKPKSGMFSHLGGQKTSLPPSSYSTSTSSASSAESVYVRPSEMTSGVGIMGGSIGLDRPKSSSLTGTYKYHFGEESWSKESMKPLYEGGPTTRELIEGKKNIGGQSLSSYDEPPEESFKSFKTPGLITPSPPTKSKRKMSQYMGYSGIASPKKPVAPPEPEPPIYDEPSFSSSSSYDEEIQRRLDEKWREDLRLIREAREAMERREMEQQLLEQQQQQLQQQLEQQSYIPEPPQQLQQQQYIPEPNSPYEIVEGTGEEDVYGAGISDSPPRPPLPTQEPEEDISYMYAGGERHDYEPGLISKFFDYTQSPGYLANINRRNAGKYIGGVAAGAALTGLAAYGIHKAYKAYKRRKTSGVSAGGGDDGSGGGGPIGHLGSALQNAKEGGKEQEPVAFPTGGGMSSLEGHGLPPLKDVPMPSKPPTVDAGNYPGGPSQEPAAPPPPPAPAVGVGGESAPPIVNAIDENWNSIKKEATGPNTDRTDPITPATGSKQTTETANSVVSAEKLRNAAESAGPEAVHGNARQRANMGKGALDSWSFNGPYDYPTYPGGRPDDTMTLMGAWRTSKGGHDSSLWYSKKTAKGADAKRNKYYKWSAKNGGNWRKLSKDEMVNVFQKASRYEGGNFYGVGGGIKFKDLIEKQLQNKDRDYKEGKVGASVMQNQKIGFAPGQRKRKRGIKDINTVDYSAHN